MKAETEYFLLRASQEARQALQAEKPEAERAHSKLSIRYSAKALILLGEEDEQEGAPRPDLSCGDPE